MAFGKDNDPPVDATEKIRAELDAAKQASERFREKSSQLIEALRQSEATEVES